MRPVRILAFAAILCLAAGAASASLVIGLSVEDQARLSTMVVVGQVIGIQGEDDPVNGIESAVTLRITEVFKGDVRPDQTVVFHLRGGEVDGVVSEAEGEAQLLPGRSVLVFIEDVDGRLYNIGLSTGVWDVQQGPGGATYFVRALQGGLDVVGGELEAGPIAFSDMANRVAWALRHGEVENPLVRELRVRGR